MSAGRRAPGLAALVVLLAGCAPLRGERGPSWRPQRSVSSAPTYQEWQAARARLREAREQTRKPRTLKVALKLREPVSGRVLAARGAVAIAPPDALRMILLGPGGTTALDLWIRGESYRFAVPAIELRKRGDAGTPASERRGLPVDFLRFWLLRPAEGELAWAEREKEAQRFLLRDGGAVVDLRWFDDKRIEARRSSWIRDVEGEPIRLSDEETVTAGGFGCAEVHYHQASTGLDVEVRCEGEELAPPAARAFADPDAEGEAP